MYEFKKTDSKDLERTIAVLIAAFMVIMLVGYLLQFFDIIKLESRVSVVNLVLTVSAMILLCFDIKFVFQKENKSFKVSDLLLCGMLFAIILSIVFADSIGMAMGVWVVKIWRKKDALPLFRTLHWHFQLRL